MTDSAGPGGGAGQRAGGNAPPPGWYPDPHSGQQRWWDGAQWGQIAGPAAAPVPGPFAPPAKSSNTLRNVLIGVFVLLVLIVGGCSAAVVLAGRAVTDSANEFIENSQAALGEVDLNGPCTLDADGFVRGTGRIENSTSKASTYIVQIRMLDGDLQVGTAAQTVTAVQPGAAAEFRYQARPTDTPTDLTCEVADVTRFATR